MKTWLTCVVALVIGCGHAVPASAKWIELRSPHFTVVGEAPDRDVRRIAEQLEQFRRMLAVVLPDEQPRVPAPVVVVVFSDDRRFGTVRPAFEGRPLSLEAYVVGDDDVNYIALSAERPDATLPAAFHEFAHVVVSGSAGVVPPWVGEGLAQFYQTFQWRDGGRAVAVGAPPADLLKVLQAGPLLPLSDVLSAGYDSALYNVDAHRSMFYAQSWALAHYLTLGDQTRGQQWRAYLRALRGGVPGAAAFAQSFGSDVSALERELREYVRTPAFRTARYDVQEPLAGPRVPLRPLSDGDAAGYVGDLLSRINRVDDARTMLRTALASEPDSGRALASLGLLELRAGALDEAMPLLERAALRAPSNASVLAAYGRGLLEKLKTRVDGVTVVRAKQALSRAIDLDPESAYTLVALAQVERREGRNKARAVELMRQAIDRAPARDDYRVLLADALIDQGEFEDATASLGVLLATTSRDEVKDRARALLAEAGTRATAKRRAEEEARLAAARAAEAEEAATRDRRVGGRVVLDLRTPDTGETRVRGTFSAVECRPGTILVQVTTADGVLRLSAEALDAVEFISYRQDTPSSVACGPQRPAFPVYATYRRSAPPATAGAGRASGAGAAPAAPGAADTPVGVAVALELLPDDYEP